MKKLILLILVLMSVSFSQGMTESQRNNWVGRVQGSVDSVNTNDDMMIFSCNTKWRNDFDVYKFEGNIHPDFSKLTFVINETKHIGYMLDITEQISSFYKLTDVLITNGNKKSTFITATALSNANNIYKLILNDYTDVIIFTGEMQNVVVRRMYNIQ